MFKPLAILLGAVLVAGSALAHPAQPAPAHIAHVEGTDEAWPTFDDDAPNAQTAVFRYRVRIDLDAARATGAWPVREYDDGGQHAAVEKKLKDKRRPRKEYPNVMGISFAEWLDAHH